MKALYRNMNDHIMPPDDLQAKVLAKIQKPRGSRRKGLRPLMAAAALMLVVVLALPVMAVYVKPIEELMYKIDPDIAARFSPIQVSDEENGIRMEVVAVSIHGATAEVYLGFTDLEGKDRISENNTRADWIQFSRKPVILGVNGCSISGGSTPMGYDLDSHTYYTLVDLNYSVYSRIKDRYLTVKEICGNKLTATVDALYRYEDKEDVELPLILKEQEIMTLRRNENGGFSDKRFTGFGLEGGGSLGDAWFQKNGYNLLTPGEVIQNVSEELAVTGAAYFEGMLHIQVRSQTLNETIVPLYDLHLVDKNRKWVSSTYAATLDMEQDGKRVTYKEYQFEVPEEDLENHTLFFDLSEEQVIRGPWRVTFPLVESDYVGEKDDGVPLFTEGTVYPEPDVEETAYVFKNEEITD